MRQVAWTRPSPFRLADRLRLSEAQALSHRERVFAYPTRGDFSRRLLEWVAGAVPRASGTSPLK